MNDDQPECRLPTPFAHPSWEPRFAIDAQRVEETSLRQGLDCYLTLCEWRGAKTFVGFLTSPSRLAVTSRDKHGFPHRLAAPTKFDNVSLDDAVALLADWLTKEAEYPPQPWFDGGEARGFQMYFVPWGQEPREFYGYVLVEPKWFEIHK